MPGLHSLPHTAFTPIYDGLSADDLARMKQVSVEVNNQMQEYHAASFSPHKLYDSFFSSEETITSFRIRQAQCKALVSGSALVAFLSRGAFVPSDLDILIPAENVISMGSFILDTDEYGLVDGSTSVQFDASKQAKMEAFVKVASLPRDLRPIHAKTILEDGYDELTTSGIFTFANNQGKRIQIIGTKCQPIEFVLHSYSTLVMNVATASKVISLYPKTSFIRKSALYLKYPSDKVLAARRKYEERGWTSSTMMSAEEALHPDHELATKTRWVGDRHCWIVHFPIIAGFESIEDSYRTLGITSWHLYCLSHTSVRVETNRMETDFLPFPLTVTWEAERAVWHHECFLALSSFMRGSRVVDYTTYVSTANQTDWLFTTASGDLSNMYPYSEVGRDSGATFEATHRTCSTVLEPWWAEPFQEVCRSDSSDLGQGIISFLSQLYPRLDAEHRENVLLNSLRREFTEMRQVYMDMIPQIGLPSAHVVSTILQCIKDIQNTGLCEEVEVTLRFWLDWEALAVWTTCTLLVPPEQEVKIKQSLPLWHFGTVNSNRLLVEISATRLEKYR
ncbi:hypothetical protein VNI00_017044 [Paramarasmius palmivorus]|uniref:F-box domain-containing protein n=1 Tax=Paramarasmius palmivorus TaxID=297713 RepID=A0AAW0B752_9AGAR